MSPRAGFAGLLVVMLCAAAASAQPSPPLPVWPGHVEDAAVQVDALDVDGEVLRGVLAPKTSIVAAPVTRRVSGRVHAKTRARALDALLALAPELAITPPTLRGGGPKVDLDFRAAPTADLYRLFADVLGTNIVVLTPSTDLTIQVKRKPAGGVLAAIAQAAGHALDRPASNLMVVRAATAPATPRLPTGGARLRVDARQIAAGHLIALIRAFEPPPSAADLLRDASLACNGGKTIDLRLTKLATTTALAVTAIAGGVNPRGPRCALPPLPPGPTVDLTLLATARLGTRRLAAVERATRAYLVTHGTDGWGIGDGWIEHGGRTWQLYPSMFADEPSVPPVAAPLSRTLRSRVRVAVIIVDGAARIAIVEVGGAWQVWHQGKLVRLSSDELFEVMVAPGEVRVRGDATEALRLAPRTP